MYGFRDKSTNNLFEILTTFFNILLVIDNPN